MEDVNDHIKRVPEAVLGLLEVLLREADVMNTPFDTYLRSNLRSLSGLITYYVVLTVLRCTVTRP